MSSAESPASPTALVTCPAVDEIVAFATGAAAAARADVEVHLDACGACRALVADAMRALHGTCSGGAPLAPLASLAGTTLGRFTLGPLLGGGAMGVVYAAFDDELRREVAVKLSRPAHDGRPGPAVATVLANVQALAEARALARIRHPNVVAVHDVELVDDVVFIVMERVDGRTLDVWARRHRPVRERARILAQAGRGLACAHAHGLVHGDVKPANVVVADGRAVVVDFGVAVEHASPQATGVRGTPAYMAPEVRGGGAVTPASDVFSFAIMAIECLTGMRPAVGATPRWPRGTPAAVVAALRGGRDQDPARRPTMAALVAALAPAARRPVRRWVAAAAVVGLAAGGGVAWSRRPDPAAASRARCAAAAERTARALWSPGHAMALRADFAGTGTPYAATSADAVTRRLEAWTDAWRSHEVARCAAPVAPATAACLAQLHRLAQRRFGQLAQADAAGVERAVAFAYELPMPAVCTAWPGSVLEARAWDPRDPVLEAVQQLDDDLRRGRVAAVEARLAWFRREAGWRQHPERARILVALGRAAAVLAHDVSAAEADLVAGAQRADEARQDYLRAEANLELAHLRLEQAGDAAGAAVALAQADAAVARSGHPPSLVVRVEAARASQALQAGDAGGAARRLAALVAAEAGEPASPIRARHLDMWGIALLELDPAAAARACAAARDMFAVLLGPRHPDTASAMLGLATALMRQGQDAAAIAVLQDALARVHGVVADDREPALMLRNNLALVLAQAGRADEAVAELTAIVAIEAARLDLPPCARRLRVGQAEVALGAALANAGRGADGVAPVERGLAMYEGCPASTAQRAHALYVHGSVLAMARGARAGVSALERAVALLAEAPALERAAPMFMLAQLVAEAAPRRARRLADEARRAYLAGGAGPDAAEVAQWLATR